MRSCLNGGGGCSPLTTGGGGGVQSAYDGSGGGLPAVVSSVPSAVAIDDEEAPDARQNSEILLHPSIPSPLADKSLIFLDFRNEAPDCLSRFDICRNLTC